MRPLLRVCPSPLAFGLQPDPSWSAKACTTNTRSHHGTPRDEIPARARGMYLGMCMVFSCARDGRVFCNHLNQNTTFSAYALDRNRDCDDQNVAPHTTIQRSSDPAIQASRQAGKQAHITQIIRHLSDIRKLCEYLVRGSFPARSRELGTNLGLFLRQGPPLQRLLASRQDAAGAGDA